MTKTEDNAIAVAGEKRYQELRAMLEPAHRGEYIIINVESGEYEIDADYLKVHDVAVARWPGGRRFVAKIGYDAICRIGSTVGKKR